MLLIAENDRKRIRSYDLLQKSQIEKGSKFRKENVNAHDVYSNDGNWYQLASSECCTTMSTNIPLDTVGSNRRRIGLGNLKRAPEILSH